MKSYRSWIPALLIAALAGLFVSPSTRISAQESARQTAAENTSGLMEARLMRFPDVYRDKIVFDFGGDLWLASISGGIARRITTHPGQELFPKFSPDGKWIAFSGQYDGNFNVYVMPSEGGQPRQLTFESDQVAVPERMGPNNEVINWTPDGKSIVFLSRRNTFNDWFGRLFTVSPEGGLPTQLPVDKGGLLSFSPDGTKMVYNRIFRNFRTWKRYTGGMAQSIWLYDFKNVTAEALTPNDHAYTYPMWRGNTLYFGSDRGADKRMNLYSMDMGTKQMRELTHFTDYDMGWPSMGPDSIILENAGYLYLFDLKAEQLKKLTIYLPGDRDQVRPHWLDASSLVTDFDISPDGKRAAFSARGDVFTVPAKYGATRNITHTPGIREHGVAWSPDGKWLAYISDRTGEEELYIQSQDGMTDPVEITSGDKGFLFPPVWSPDSKKLAYSDQKIRLFYVDIDAKKPVQVDTDRYAEFTDYTWSPDSKWLSYTKLMENHNGIIELYSLANSKITHVTDDFTSSSNPAFDPAGKYLYFISSRDYNEVPGVYDWEFANMKTQRVYVVTLRADEPSPFAPRSDEVSTGKEAAGAAPQAQTNPPKDSATDQTKGEKKDETKTEAQKKEEAAKEFRIDLDGLGQRTVALPPPSANISQVGAGDDQIFYVTQPIGGLSGPLPGEDPKIHVYDMKERKDSVLVGGADTFALSFDHKKMLYSAPGGPSHTYGIVDTTPASEHKAGEGAISLSGLRMEVDPRAEWKQMFSEVYRQERDYFFEASMNGVDWEKVRDRYAILLPYVASRYDLVLLLGDMIGELSNSHTYTGGGDMPDLSPVNVGMLGVDFGLDPANGRYKFAKILEGENWNPAHRSPLTEPGVNIKAGDYLLAVNGRPLKAPTNPYELFVGTAGQNVTLTVNSTSSEQGARNVVVQTINTEYALRELDWITANRLKVDAATNGRVGYVYLPNMGDEGLNEFMKQYFPQIRKEGMIVDVRYNGGGFVDQMIFERLRRMVAGMGSARNFAPDTEPGNVFYGSMACITNEYAASDGDFFSHFFKQYKLGPLVGMRTWGGVRGIRGEIPLMDGGYITRPEFSLYGMDSQWLIENYGVVPDVEVDNPPDQVMKGRDPQLEKTIELVMKDMREHPRKLPPLPPDLPAYPKHDHQ
ncbi:MAG: PDZ domain-containing protein [Candidatus Acidiferrales bacterium]